MGIVTLGKRWLSCIHMVHGTICGHLQQIGTKGSSGSSTLSWVQRLKICIGAARELDYLHTGTSVIDRVVQRDEFKHATRLELGRYDFRLWNVYSRSGKCACHPHKQYYKRHIRVCGSGVFLDL